ncbi:MAG: DUF479 domain-containing protein [Hormoscilla sp. GUM202]|nr:DUF479 domain-containing protein [Hormoscilla sp. GUM202]
MNYLAHLFLAGPDPYSRIGNLLGDLIKGNLSQDTTYYSEGIIQGIKLHRQIDTFTDTHRIYLESKRRISPQQGLFSGIIIDICYDHFLANHWPKFSERQLSDFVADIYGLLESHQQILPTRLQQVLPKMVAEDWLGSYKTLSGLNLTFARLARRLQGENHLPTAVEDIANNYVELESDFLSFFPEEIGYTSSLTVRQMYPDYHDAESNNTS